MNERDWFSVSLSAICRLIAVKYEKLIWMMSKSRVGGKHWQKVPIWTIYCDKKKRLYMTCNGCFWRGLVNCLPMSLNFIYLFVITLALPIAFFFADYEWNSRRGHDIIFYLFPLNGQIKLSKPALINYAYLSDFSLSMWEKSDSANVVWHFQFIWIASLAFVISIN